VGSRRPVAPDFVSSGSILLCSKLPELVCRTEQLPSGFEVQPLERETEPLDNVVSIAFPVPAALIAELHVVPRILRIEKLATIPIVYASKADEGQWSVRKSLVEQPDDTMMFDIKFADQGILCFQHKTQPVCGVPTQQPARVHLPDHVKS
jgi:hypothetical protein